MISDFLLALAVAAGPAQVSHRAPDEIICLSVLRLWDGSSAEVRDIQKTPFPPAFRQAFGGQGDCNNLDQHALIDWHLKVGDEQTIMAALRVIEEDYLTNGPTAAEFLKQLAPAVRKAKPQLEALGHLKTGPTYLEWYRQTRSNQSIARLADLAAAHVRLTLIAGEYLRAAEFYRSPVLLERGRPYLRAASEGIRLLYDDAQVAMASDQGAADMLNQGRSTYINLVRDYERRVPLLNARISGLPVDLDAARQSLSISDEGLLTAAARVLSDEGKDPCRIKREQDTQGIRDACGSENSFELRLRDYWMTRAQVELLTEPAERYRLKSFRYALNLQILDLERQTSDPIPFRRSTSQDNLVRLKIAFAEAAHIASSRPGDEAEGRQDRRDALAWLIDAEKDASPASHPGLFRQIANRYLKIWSELLAHRDSEEAAGDAALERTSSYMSRMLVQLPAIINAEPLGETAPDQK